MQKGGMKTSSIAIMVAFALSCFGLLLFLWLAFGGPIPLQPKGYRVSASFTEATTLAVEADVRISGVRVGKVKTIEPNKTTGRSDVVIEIEHQYAPLSRNVRATLRQKTLLGETYVELTPGAPDGQTIPENGHISQAAIASSVQLDEIFRAFDPKTREAFRVWMQEQATAINGHGADVNAAFGNLGPFAEDASTLLRIIRRQQPAVQRLVRNTGTVFDALSERDGQLTSLIRNLNVVFKTTADRDDSLKAAFIALPTFQREARTTLRRLDAFAANTNPLISQLRPAARELSPTLIDLKKLAPVLEAVFRDLDPLIEASKTGFPAAERLLDDLQPFLEQVHPTMQQLLPILQFVGPYKSELTAFLGNTVAATQATDVVPGTTNRVHYLRTTNPVSPEMLAFYPRRIGSNRPNPYMFPRAFDQLKDGLPVFEDRQCGRGVPVVSQQLDPLLDQIIPPALEEQIQTFMYPVTSNGQFPAPPCRKQGPFTFQGETSDYPHVKPAP
jgi:phospholipid/cholesterol/gamma-HCH transport system substrate-binding protein